MTRYPTASELFAAYNPDLQSRLLRRHVRLGELGINAAIPTLGLLSETYGQDAADTWLSIQFDGLDRFAGQARGMDDDQLGSLCAMVAGEYCWLNLAEVCLFVAWFKMGKYGTFYGAVDPIKITEALHTFIRQRAADIDSVERERRRRELEARPVRRPDAITWEEWRRLSQSQDNNGENNRR